MNPKAEPYDPVDYLLDSIIGFERRPGAYRVAVSLVGLKSEDEETWELLNDVLDDTLSISKYLVDTYGDRNTKQVAIDLYVYVKSNRKQNVEGIVITHSLSYAKYACL